MGNTSASWCPASTFRPQAAQASSSNEGLIIQIQEVLSRTSQSHYGKHSITSTSSNPKKSVTEKDESETHVKDRVKACRSLRNFENLVEDAFCLDQDNEKLICVASENSESDKHGIFTITGIEFDNLPSRSRKFRNLQSNNHKMQIILRTEQEAKKRQRRQKTLLIGRILGSLAYLIFF